MKKEILTKWSIRIIVILVLAYSLFKSYIQSKESEKFAAQAKNMNMKYNQEKEISEKLKLQLDKCIQKKATE